MINIKHIIQKMILLTIILSTTDKIRLPIESVSLFRVSLIISILLAFIYIVANGKIKNGRYLYFIILLLLSAPISYLISIHKEWAFSSTLNEFMGIALIFLVVNFFNRSDLNLLLRTFIYSQIITIIFSLLSLYYFYILNYIPHNINIFNILYIEFSEEFIDRATTSTNIRLTLPYSTPPHLSILMAATIGILYINKAIFSSLIRWTFLVSFFFILVFTGSRTAIVASILTLITIGIIKFKPIFNIKRSVIAIFIFLISIIVLSMVNLEYIDKYLQRFIITDLLSDRHLLVPIEGILLWISSFSHLLIGIGSGSSLKMSGQFTFLPPHFLNSYVTLIAERGLLGLLIVIEYLRIFKNSLFKMKFDSSQVNRSLYISILIILFSVIFYEARQNISVWVLFSIVFILEGTAYKGNLKQR